MTLEEFNNIKFYCGMQVEYSGKVFPLASVDFQEGLIAIIEVEQEDPEDEELSWKRCENCRLIPEPVTETETTTTATGNTEIEYKKITPSQWEALFDNKVIGVLSVDSFNNRYDMEEGECKVYARDCRLNYNSPEPIPGSPFDTMNHARAAIEYHFRELLDRRTEFAA